MIIKVWLFVVFNELKTAFLILTSVLSGVNHFINVSGLYYITNCSENLLGQERGKNSQVWRKTSRKMGQVEKMTVVVRMTEDLWIGA